MLTQTDKDSVIIVIEEENCDNKLRVSWK